MAASVYVNLGDRGYDIRIGTGAQVRTDWPDVRRVLLLSDSNVDPLHGNRVAAQYATGDVTVERVVVPAGESSKALDRVAPLYEKAVTCGLDRSGLIVALGGGVVGDLGGFFAATYLRGVRYVQVPTSLLAMVDSSVGGKTGVNLPQGKNLVGAFYQPIEVVIDLDTLQTLPAREYISGLAEVVKYGVIWDAALFRLLEENVPGLIDRDAALMADVVAQCCTIKAEVVAMDEHDMGMRAILNFGHTYAHALEKASAYGTLLHGEAVAIGMVYAADLSARHKGLPAEDADRLRRLLQALGLPVRLPGADLPWDAVRGAMGVDKKTLHGTPRFVLAQQLGKVAIGCAVPEDAMAALHAAVVESD